MYLKIRLSRASVIDLQSTYTPVDGKHTSLELNSKWSWFERKKARKGDLRKKCESSSIEK